MRLSVVVPTFNRGASLVATIQGLLDGDTTGLDAVEVIVVDDGSSTPAETFLKDLRPRPPVTLVVRRQANAGPARARNAGFRAASGEVVLFVDDDILPSTDLLVGHVTAHRQRPESVICGRCPWLPPASPGAVYRMLDRLGYDASTGTAGDYVPIPLVASGQISVTRSMFDAAAGVYRDGLVTPAAEEFELSWRLKRRGTPILLAARLSAFHDSPTTLAFVCAQQYKHGVGLGEVARRCPETLELSELAQVIQSNAPVTTGNVIRRAASQLRHVASCAPARRLVLGVARAAEASLPQADAFRGLYRLAIAQHFVAGVRDGLKRFASG